MAISNERLKELVQIYNNLKAKILQVDQKYSLDFIEPELDMPESLNLTKLTYNPKSKEELMSLAEQHVASYVISKQATLDKNLNAKFKSLSLKSKSTDLAASDKMLAAERAFEEERKSIHNRLVNNGLFFSTLYDKYDKEAQERFETKASELKAKHSIAIKFIEQEYKDAEDIYYEACNSLAKEKAAKINAYFLKLLADEEALKRSIEKYNTGLDEKEAKYQASRARAYEQARRAAYQRAYENSKLYMQMGETGYRRMIEREKYSISQDAFYTLRREEAKAILSMDSFLIVHLGVYYEAFVDWVNTTLLP